MDFRKKTIVAALFVLLLYGGLILSLGYFLSPKSLLETLRSERTLFSIRISLEAATLATLLAMSLAIPAGYALSRYRFRGRELIDTLLEFPMIVSPAALGAMLLIFFNNPAGEWIQEHLITFVFAFAGIVLAQFVTILGVSVRLVKSAFDEVPEELESTARTLGAAPGYVLRSVTLPLARRGLVAATILSWAKALGEFGATITVAGTMAMRTETLPIAIYLRLENADIRGTAVLILILVAIGLSALFLTRRLLSRSGL
ncbi:ABC transporter permease [Nitratifractor salsuginis]|uniref:Binding-protein-dependent transport systems inner membrane component n=1 Tax=Nitratifractor salsuginis (strain DSM 16511 / JCM 12458 / E9I37-1) TaxID=749222 RepID=E6WYP2_NITSE|nr:ABC transporter permease subunit [Nitratifractor salsuginis]ADV45413.1 binding-protein-dependent transport systems inner membrane component [Nitratifractor salsuginis DSM 16511]